jgi:hypothetical protein
MRNSIQRLADEAPVPDAASWPARRPPSFKDSLPPSFKDSLSVERKIFEAFAAQASKTAPAMIKERAAIYLDKRWQLDSLRPGFFASEMTPPQLIAFAAEVLRQEIAFGRFELVPIRKINARAAIVVGRYFRAKDHQRKCFATRIGKAEEQEP